MATGQLSLSMGCPASSDNPTMVVCQCVSNTLEAEIPVSRSDERFHIKIRMALSTKITPSCMLSSNFV